jgi:hypothetical protein
MITLTKKCPHCGSKRFTPRTPSPWTALLPFIKTFSCQDCCQLFRYFFPIAVAFENRGHPRSELPINFLLRIQGLRNQYARITNISPGGLSFTHHNNLVLPDTRLLMVDLYDCNNGSSLESLQLEVVFTSEQQVDRQGTKISVFQNSARFIHLNQAQKKVLATCIQQNGSPLVSTSTQTN